MMADDGLLTSDVITTSVGSLDNVEQITVVACATPDGSLLGTSGCGEPAAKRLKLEDSLVQMTESSVSIKQILFNINQAICLRLDAIEAKLESMCNTTQMLESKLEQLYAAQNNSQQLNESPNTSASNIIQITGTPGGKDNSANSTPVSRKGGAVVVGLPQSNKIPITPGDDLSDNDEEIQQEKYVVNMAGSNNMTGENSIQNLGPNVTLITLNSEEDFPHGTWLGDENNPEMRVRVPVSPSDLLHIHSNCRSAEKMALTLLDYLFDRETQAYSNLSGLGKHGKKQLDPLMIYGIRCHLIHHFNISEQDWHRIKQNINSKCRTAFRRKIRGLPLTVKAFRGKAPPTYIHVQHGMGGHRMRHSDLGDTSDDSLQQGDEELTIQTEVDPSQANLIPATTSDIIQSAGGQIQVLHATPEQVAQLQQTHQIQILQGDQIMQFQVGQGQESIHVAVPMSQQADNENIHIVNAENGETIDLGPGSITQEVTQEVIGHHMTKVEHIDSDQE